MSTPVVLALVALAFVTGVLAGAMATWPMAQRAAVLASGPVCPPVR